MNRFQVGDRVSVWLDGDMNKRYFATVKKLMPYGNLQVDISGAHSGYTFPVVHPRQCRRLVKRKRLRSVWIEQKSLNDLSVSNLEATRRPYVPGDIEFREVRKRKV